MGQNTTRQVPPNGIVGTMPAITNEITTGWQYHYRVPLQPGRKYLFDCWSIGSFPITGGSCGYFTVELNRLSRVATVYDGTGSIFQADQHNDRVTIQDNPDGGSSVILTQLGQLAKRLPIPIKALDNEEISLMGSRSFIVNGSGALLKHAGSDIVTVNGNLRKLEYEGSGLVRVRGSVEGDVRVEPVGTGNITVDGSVEGNISHDGHGIIEVMGDLKGNVIHDGPGKIHIHGKHHGIVVRWSARGNLQVDNEEKKEDGKGEEEDKKMGAGDA